MPSIEFVALARCNSRSCSYSVKQMTEALTLMYYGAELEPTRAGALLCTRVQVKNEIEALALRRDIERQVHNISYNIPYQFKYER